MATTQSNKSNKQAPISVLHMHLDSTIHQSAKLAAVSDGLSLRAFTEKALYREIKRSEARRSITNA
jgi:predicted HicB family RNase H-like nuclease